MCLLAAGGAFALKPRRRFSLLGDKKLADVTPRSIPGWTSTDVGDLTASSTPDSLVSRLYGELVQRVYHNQASGDEVMMLLAHGDSQTNDLQVHRPEECYPAFGFELGRDRSIALPVSNGVTVPARVLLATAVGGSEGVVYWVRLGDSLPNTEQAQRIVRLRTAMEGFIADGLLARFSVSTSDDGAAVSTIGAFVPALLAAVGAASRAAFIGTARAALMDRSQALASSAVR
jgi:EpsI family protein